MLEALCVSINSIKQLDYLTRFCGKRMTPASLIFKFFGVIILTFWSDTKYLLAMAYTFKRHNPKLSLKPETQLHTDFDLDEELATEFLKKIDRDIKFQEKKLATTTRSTISKNLPGNELDINSNIQQGTTTVNINQIMHTPTNRRRVLMQVKNGLYLMMDDNGTLKGTTDTSNHYATFVIESLSTDVVRLKGEKANKYICMDHRGKIVTREKGIPKCYLNKFMEENHHDIFWSYKYGNKNESGWLLALRNNGKTRKPYKTTLGDTETQFFLHYLKNNT